MGTSTTLMTVQEFLALPQVEGERRIGGEVVSMPLTRYPHEVTKANFMPFGWLRTHSARCSARRAFKSTRRIV